MANAIAALKTRSPFPYEKWSPQRAILSRQFRENSPYPHLQFKEFLDPDVARAMATEFPGLQTDAWTRYKHQNENKLGLAKRSLFPHLIGAVVDELTLRSLSSGYRRSLAFPDCSRTSLWKAADCISRALAVSLISTLISRCTTITSIGGAGSI